MYIPEWLTEARFALIIASVSAVLTGINIVYARRMAHNDTLKMQRKLPVVEFESWAFEGKPDWQNCRLVIRNLEPVSAILVSAETVARNAYVLTDGDARQKADRPFELGPVLDELPKKKRVELNRTVAPVSVRYDPNSVGPFSTIYVSLVTKGVSQVSDLKLTWRWADGQK